MDLERSFIPLYFAEKLRVINPYGTIGVATLWSSVDWVISKFRNEGVDLGQDTSKIAVFGTLYGDGLKHLLRNLLYNPQIQALLVVGRDMGQSYRCLSGFFERGVEEFGAGIEYSGSNVKSMRVKGTDYVMDNLVRPELFVSPPIIKRIEGTDSTAVQKAAEFVHDFKSPEPLRDRLQVEIPEIKVISYPSNLRSHTIIADAPSEAWRHLVHRIFRFGRRVTLKKGERIELQNVKVVIESPRHEGDAAIQECGFDPDSFSAYQESILSKKIPSDVSYTYGNRMRAYFGFDCLEEVIKKLKRELDDRSAFISLWNTQADLFDREKPCLVSLFFRKIDNKVYLTAIFRTHNAGSAWLENVYGLMAVQEYIAARTGNETGAITVFSLSISLDPQTLERVKEVHDQVSGENVFREDSNGYFLVSIDGPDIVLTHMHRGLILGEYRGDNPIKIQNELARNHAISDINHAIYIGRQLEKAHLCIQAGIPYSQED